MFVAETVFLVALVCKHEKEDKTVMIASGNAPVRLYSDKAALVIPFVPADTLAQAIIKDFGSIAGVSSVNVEHENGEVLVWIAMHNPPRELRYQVYDRQAALIEAFPEVDINFNLIPA